MNKAPFLSARFLVILLGTIALAGCASHSGSGGGSSNYKVGEPYQVKGEWYYPKEDYSYDETGIASWYGADFHGQKTANGEIYNKDELTAAHKTLPLPSLARVTNLDNGKSIVVRINDRGPFVGTRLIDVSQRSAQLLGFEQNGTANVRVQVLADESKAIADAMRHYGGKPITSVASNAPSTLPPNMPASVQTASIAPVTRETLEQPSPESARLEPIQTTPQVHKALLDTHPVAEVVQLPVTGANHIYVQAGAFTVLENATKLQQTLGRFGHADVTNAIVNGTKFYRVRVGPVSDVPQADALVGSIQRAGISHPRIVID
jgi:rare lipoprotein A